MPALSLAAIPGRRRATIELATEIENRGFSGIYGPSLGDSLALCEALAFATKKISFGTSIMPLYFRQVIDFASTASFIHEISNGRFRFGVGVSHGPMLDSRGIVSGKPLSDTRKFVEELRQAPRVGELPPIILATLRKKMIALAEEIGQGMVFANGARSHMQDSLSVISDDAIADDKVVTVGFFVPRQEVNGTLLDLPIIEVFRCTVGFIVGASTNIAISEMLVFIVVVIAVVERRNEVALRGCVFQVPHASPCF